MVAHTKNKNKIKKTRELRAYRDITKGKAKKIVEVPYKNNKKYDNILEKDEKLIKEKLEGELKVKFAKALDNQVKVVEDKYNIGFYI